MSTDSESKYSVVDLFAGAGVGAGVNNHGPGFVCPLSDMSSHNTAPLNINRINMDGLNLPPYLAACLCIFGHSSILFCCFSRH